MAQPNTNRAIAYRFDAPAFRNAIGFVYEMATPTAAAEHILFHFTETVSFVGASDGDAVPFDPNATITRTSLAPVAVPCDVEFIQSTEVPTAFGVVVPSRLRVTLLDADWNTIKTCTYATVSGERYLRDYEQPAGALFDVTLHTITFVAENER